MRGCCSHPSRGQPAGHHPPLLPMDRTCEQSQIPVRLRLGPAKPPARSAGAEGEAVPRPHRGRAAVTIPNLCREGTSEIPGVGGERSALHSSSRSGEQAKHLPAACSCSQICYDLSLRQEGMSASLESKRGCGAAGAGGRCCWTWPFGGSGAGWALLDASRCPSAGWCQGRMRLHHLAHFIVP